MSVVSQMWRVAQLSAGNDFFLIGKVRRVGRSREKKIEDDSKHNMDINSKISKVV